MRLLPLPLLLASLLAIPLGAQQPTLRPFESDAQLVAYFRVLHAEQERARDKAQAEYRRYAEAMAKCQKDAISLRITPRPDTSAAPRIAVISGRVTNGSGEPQPGASLSIPELKLATTSASNGRYRLAIPAESLSRSRRVTVRATLIGFHPVARTVTVSRRDSVDFNVRLCGAAVSLDAVTVSGAQAPSAFAAREQTGLTNTQHSGVDEGGIVKRHGNHLVILRRGRLFTVAIGGSDLSATAAVDAFGPDVNPSSTWYDELLVAGDKVVVIGYSYDRGGTEVGVFDIDARGRLTYVATYQLRSNDYYSARNYASRLIGTKLIFYAPLYLWGNLDDPIAALPAMRRWARGARDDAFRRIAPAPRIYRSPLPPSGDDIALHTVTICDLAVADLGCVATVIVGPSGRVFYVSPTAVYVWASPWTPRYARAGKDGTLYRMPLDGSAPSALGVTGTPVDQFSFLESPDGRLNVLVRSDAWGDAMWLPEWAAGNVALLRVPLRLFGDGTDRLPWWRYYRLPIPAAANHYAFHNRFVGDYLLYGMGTGWGRPRGDSTTVYAARWTDDDADPAVTRLRVAHGVDRIEALGADAVIVGADASDLQFTGIRLSATPQVAQRYTLPGASQGELRSHGFFYRGDAADAGVLGLPIRQAGRAGYEHLRDASAGIVFVRNAAGRFTSLGVLRAGKQANNDGCRASCVDWYGNARPLFIGERIFALLGYELVEGAIAAGEIRELRRTSYAPGRATVAR